MSHDLVITAEGGAAIAAPASLSDTARDFAKQSMAQNTRRNYAVQFSLWQAHAQRAGIPSLPADPVHVSNWLAQRAADGAPGGRRAKASAQGQSVGSLRVAVAALVAAHRAAGHTFDGRHPAIATVLRGIARSKAELPAQVAPLRAGLILDVLASLGSSPIERRDAALISIGYIFGRRRSEIVGLDLDRLGEGDGILLRDAHRLSVILVRHKTADGTAKTFVAPRAPNRVAAEAVETWIALAGIEPGSPVFRRVLQNGVVLPDRLGDAQVPRIIRRRIASHLVASGAPKDLALAEADKYSGHSLRVGLAVTSAEAGVDLRAIQGALGHASPAMASRYAQAAEQERTSPHHAPGVGLGGASGSQTLQEPNPPGANPTSTRVA